MTANPEATWRVVPAEPSEAMVEAGRGNVDRTNPYSHDVAENIYLAMLKAAPVPGSEEVRVRPLEWRCSLRDGTPYSTAETILGDAAVWTHHEAAGQWFWKLGAIASGAEAAEADATKMLWLTYEHRIRSALFAAQPASDDALAMSADGSLSLDDAIAGVVDLFPSAHKQALRCLGELLTKRPSDDALAKMTERADVTEDQIKRMVDRFLAWKLPDSFNPDGGISFERDCNVNTPWPSKREPSGTNLLDAAQATEMVRYLLAALTAPRCAQPPVSPIARDGSLSADWIAMVLAEDATIEDGRLTNGSYLAVKFASASDAIVARAVSAETALAEMTAERDEALTAFSNGAYADACKGGGDIYQHALALTVEKFRTTETALTTALAEGDALRKALRRAHIALRAFADEASAWDSDVPDETLVEVKAPTDDGCDYARFNVADLRRAQEEYNPAWTLGEFSDDVIALARTLATKEPSHEG